MKNSEFDYLERKIEYYKYELEEAYINRDKIYEEINDLEQNYEEMDIFINKIENEMDWFEKELKLLKGEQ